MSRDVFGIVGSTLEGNFHVESVVAEGGFGVVYRAEHGAFRAKVALKCLKVPSTLSDEDCEKFLEKFREEGELLFRLSASIPEVVRPLHVGTIEITGKAVPFLALEWLEGESLDTIVFRRGRDGKPPMNVQKAVRLLTPIARALSRAHHFPTPSGPVCIVHRDMKPENVFIARTSSGDTPKILDYGIARAKSATTSGMGGGIGTEPGALTAFTPAYAAPEQWAPRRFGPAGPWTDVYGLALTLVHVLIGRQPIEGELPEMMGTALDPARRPTPREEGATVSDDLEAAFAGALAVDPRQRTQSIEAFWTEVETALGLPPSLRPRDDREEMPLLESLPPTGGVGLEVDLALEKAPRSTSHAETMPLADDALRAPALPSELRSPTPEAPQPAPDFLASLVPAAQRQPPARSPSPMPGSPARSPSPMPGPLQDRFDIAMDLASPGAPRSPSPMPGAPARSPSPMPGPRQDRFDIPMDLASAPRPLVQRRITPQPEAPARIADLGLGERLSLPLRLMGLAALIAIGDVVYTRVTGELLSYQGARPVWIAGPLAAISIALGIWKML